MGWKWNPFTHKFNQVGGGGSFLNLDQTTPQSVTNGVPYFVAGINASNYYAPTYECNLPPMTSNILPSPLIATAANTFNGYLPYLAFNQIGPQQVGALSTTPPSYPWNLQLYLGVAKTITAYGVTATATDQAGALSRSPKTWTFQGSNNGIAWTTLDTQTNVPYWYADETRMYVIASPASFTYYRINITANHSGPYVEVCQLKLYETTASRKKIYIDKNGTVHIIGSLQQIADIWSADTYNGTQLARISYDGVLRLNKYVNNGLLCVIDSNGTVSVDTNTYLTAASIGGYITPYLAAYIPFVNNIQDAYFYNNLLFFGNNNEMSVGYDSSNQTGNIRTDESTPSDLNVFTGNGATLRLINPVYDEIVTHAESMKDSYQSVPWTSLNGGKNKIATFSPDGYGGDPQELDFTVELPHNFVEGDRVTITPSVRWVGWTDNGDGNWPLWELSFTKQKIGFVNVGELFDKEDYIDTDDIHIPSIASVVPFMHYETYFGNSGSGLITFNDGHIRIMSKMKCTIRRIDDGGSYPDDVGLLSVNFKIEVDTIGSRTMDTK